MPKTQKDLPQDAALQAGLVTRNQVMGSEYVDRALGGASDYTLPMQEFITRNAWGNVWQRPGLAAAMSAMAAMNIGAGRWDRVDQIARRGCLLSFGISSAVTVAMLAAQGKHHELKAHVRGALNNGVTPEELREVMLHATVYCGFPTAIDAFRCVAEVVEAKA